MIIQSRETYEPYTKRKQKILTFAGWESVSKDEFVSVEVLNRPESRLNIYLLVVTGLRSQADDLRN